MNYGSSLLRDIRISLLTTSAIHCNHHFQYGWSPSCFENCYNQTSCQYENCYNQTSCQYENCYQPDQLPIRELFRFTARRTKLQATSGTSVSIVSVKRSISIFKYLTSAFFPSDLIKAGIACRHTLYRPEVSCQQHHQCF